MPNPLPTAVYGLPPPDAAATPLGARQLSPLVPGASDLAELPDGGLAELVVLAPPGVLERRFVLAQALRALAPGGALTALARTDRGGRRLKSELVDFGCAVVETARRHHRVCVTRRPEAPVGLEDAIAEGGPRRLDDVGLWTQPGVFSWDRLDPGTALLLKHLPPLHGAGADLGAGIGWLAQAVLASPKVKHLALVDLDRRAIEAARRNVVDERADFLWADVGTESEALSGLDFVVMNPPFHDGGIEDQRLGQAFLRAAAGMLRSRGLLWLVANRHLAYEAVLAGSFAEVRLVTTSGGYKVYEARRWSSGAGLRLDRLLANLGYGTRAEVQALVRSGSVRLDGAPLRDPARHVEISPDLRNLITVHGEALDPPAPLSLMLHKPTGFACAHRAGENGPLVYELLPPRWQRRKPALSSVGRLDKDTSGLLLITDDGDYLHRVISPRSHVPKAYLATLDQPLTGAEAALFASGTLQLVGEKSPLLPATLEPLGPRSARLILAEGRYHQVRRMFAAVGNRVLTLHRERIGGLMLPADLTPGAYRLLDVEEATAVFAD